MASKKKTGNTSVTLGLEEIVRMTKAGEVAYTSVDEHKPLIEQGLVEINASLIDENGKIATRATNKAIEQIGGSQDTEEESIYKIEEGIPVPAVIGRGRVGSVYPFDKLGVGQSFFVAKPAKNLASTVSSANNRFAEEIPGETRTNRKGEIVPKMKHTRKFVVRSVEGGSRIWRTA